MSGENNMSMIKIVILSFASLLVSACGFEQVDEGYRGIETHWGKMVGEPLSPGLHFYNPISNSIFEMAVREQKLEGKTTCFTKDTQTVTVSYAITYYPKQEMIGKIYSQFGLRWEEKIIIPTVLGTLKDSTGQYIADDLVSKREAVKTAAQSEIHKALADRDVVVTRLDLTDLDFENAYEKAVEDKVVAIQRANEAKNKTVEIEEKAKQTIAAAKAEAESMRIRANALTQNKGLVDYEAVQKWDGKLPQYMTGNAIPFINIKSR
jgi:regulator of protease activity HflC (stomatin/prohibitin superfamily)